MLLQRWDKMLGDFFRFDDNLPREKPPEMKSGLTLDHQKYFFTNDDDSSPFWSVLLQLKLI